VIRSGEEEIGSVFVMKNGVPIVCNRLPIKENGKIIGAVSFATFTKMDQLNSVISKYEQLQGQLKQAQSELRQLRGARYSLNQIIGETPGMIAMKELISRLAQTRSSVLITGETGTGKELVAHSLHQAGPRWSNSFIRLNCAAIPKDLLESELFGYEDGAFSGAKKGGKIGKIQAADKGTLLLDEIHQLPLQLQAKLLRVIQEKEIEKLGGLKTIPIDFRLICASNVSLPDLVEKEEFREDLYYRINVVEITVPPLRDRREDIPILVEHLIDRINIDLGLHIQGVDSDVLELFMHYDWPGNVRELSHALERAANLVCSGRLPLACFEHISVRLIKEGKLPGEIEDKPLAAALATVEKAEIARALMKAQGNKAQAARLLNMDRSVLYDKIKKYKIAQSY
jgi:transcriptional regulator with PAS, ATPase and Fis domain